MESLNLSDIEYCEQRIAQEEAVARSASSREAGEVHEQMAMLYKAQLQVLKATAIRG